MLEKNFGKLQVKAWYYEGLTRTAYGNSLWGHKCEIIINNGETWTPKKISVKTPYFNRTREEFQFKSVISRCLEKFEKIYGWKCQKEIKKIREFLKMGE